MRPVSIVRQSAKKEAKKLELVLWQEKRYLISKQAHTPAWEVPKKLWLEAAQIDLLCLFCILLPANELNNRLSRRP